MLVTALWSCTWGRGQEGVRHLLHSPLDFSFSLCYQQSNWAPLVLVPKWVGLCMPWPLWVSPKTCPVRLGVSPAAAPTPTGVFTQRFEALFPSTGALGYEVCSAPHFILVYLCPNMGPWGATQRSICPFCTTLSPALSVYLCVNVGLQGLLVVRLPAPFVPHSASLGPAMATQVLSTPAARLRPSYGSGWMFIFYLLGVGFLAVRFSVSSGCARRRSVSTYATILVLSTIVRYFLTPNFILFIFPT